MTHSHHAGHLKQSNKKHKGEKKRCSSNQPSLHQIRGTHKSKLKRLMQHRGSEENPILCVIIPLAADIPANLAQVLLKTCDPQAKCIRNNADNISGLIHIKSGSLKKCFGIVTASFKSTFSCLDLAYLADWIVFLVPTAHSQLSAQSEELLTVLYAQGFINASFAVMSSDGDLSVVRDIVGSRFHIPDGRLHRLNTKADAFALLRHVSTSSGHQKHIAGGQSLPEMVTQHSAARFRSGMLADAIHLQSCPDGNNQESLTNSSLCTPPRAEGGRSKNDGFLRSYKVETFLQVSGYLRGSPMFLSDSIDSQSPTLHLSGWGDFSLHEANWTVASGNKLSWKLMDHPQQPQQGNDISSLMDTMDASSDDDASDCEEEEVDIVKSGDESSIACDMDTETGDNSGSDGEQPDEGSVWGNSVCSAASAFSTAQLMKFRAARMEELFPDEDYHRNRRSILRYLGKRLNKLTETPSNQVDFIPVGAFVHLTIGPVSKTTAAEIVSRHKLSEAPNLPIDNLTSVSDKSPVQPLVLWSLLPHETRLSVCHFAMHRLSSAVCPGFDAMKLIDSRNSAAQMDFELGEDAENQEALSGSLPPPEAEPIKLKEIMMFQVGIRRFVTSPIYSTICSGSQKKTKLEQFFNPSRNGTLATVYAPVMYAPTNVLQFRIRVDEDNDMRENKLPYVSELVATGNLHSVDPWLVILKRIFLAGHPYKINKRNVVSRFMFFSPNDIEYFKQVPLQTKNGASGHIKEPVGTHGHMKCVFDRKITSSDVVLMPLYKRVFPKWTCDPRTPEALRVNATFERISDESSCWFTSTDKLQLRKKNHAPPEDENVCGSS